MLNSYADMIRLANMPKVVQASFETIPFYFWIPAFKVLPAAFLRLARSMITAQPQEELIPKLPEGGLHSVTLSHIEAIRSLTIHLAGLIRPKTLLQEILKKIENQSATHNAGVCAVSGGRQRTDSTGLSLVCP
ncbi:MAG: hypothetical protein HC887_07805 [Desulfobacteraceae bacterium]|nr:hypothetical protein [Desulfobacteraceae bacterium]